MSNDLIRCEVCGEACHGLDDAKGGRAPRCLKHLPEGPATTEEPAPAKKSGKKGSQP